MLPPWTITNEFGVWEVSVIPLDPHRRFELEDEKIIVGVDPASLHKDRVIGTAARAIHDGPLMASDEEFTEYKTGEPASNWCREVARVAYDVIVPEGHHVVPFVPTEAQWGGLARQLIFSFEMPRGMTPIGILTHLRRTGHEIPGWLHDEINRPPLTRTLSKGTRAALVYKAMLHDFKY